MKTSKHVPILALICILSCGCLPYYGPALNVAHMPGIISASPSGNNTASTAIYATLDGGNVDGTNSPDLNTIFRGHILFVRSGKYSTVNLGAFAYGGKYFVKSLSEYNGDHSYYGPGAEFNGEIHYPVRRVDLGMGMYFAAAGEFGDYLDFRKDPNTGTIADTNGSRDARLFFLYPLIRYRVSERTSIALQLPLGNMGDINDSEQNTGPILMLQHDDLVFSSSWVPAADGYPNTFTIGIGKRIK